MIHLVGQRCLPSGQSPDEDQTGASSDQEQVDPFKQMHPTSAPARRSSSGLIDPIQKTDL
jgi:hypothetical protein